MKTRKDDPERYWIATNGSSCALSITPMIDAETVPTAEQMWGFPTLEEAQSAQHIILTASMPQVTTFLQALGPDIKSGRVVYKQPANPGPQTRGRTGWMDMAQGPLPDGIAASLVEVADAVNPLPPNKEQLRRIRQMAERRRKDAH